MTETILELCSKPLRVLVADDDDQIRSMLVQFLTEEGYEVTEACDGEKAISSMAENQAELLITDIVMPNQEGIETIRLTKKNYPDTKIIAISGGGRIGPQTFLPMAQKFGADRIMEKPFDPDELLDAVKELIGQPE